MADFSGVIAGLEALGFKKRQGRIFTREFANGCIGWLGFNRATKHHRADEYEVFPVVGLRHQEIENTISDLRGDKRHSYIPPTVSTPMYLLSSDRKYLTWTFEAEGPNDGATESLLAAITDLAVPFMDSPSLLKICGLLDNGVGHDHLTVYRRPVAWYLAGQEAHALSILRETEISLGDRTDAYSVELRAFIAAFREKLKLSPSD